MANAITNNIIEEKSFAFAIRVVNLYKYLTKCGCEKELSKQLLRSGTSIGANVAEGVKGQSKADFNTKFNIALKEANETAYWLALLHATEYIGDKEYESIVNDVKEIIRILVSIVKKTNIV